MNSWLVACHALQDYFGQITLPFYNDDGDLRAFLWQWVVVIVVLITSECYLASTEEIFPHNL